MSSMLSLSSQAVVVGAAMAVSSTVLFLAFSKPKSPPSPPILRSCLSTDAKRKERKKEKKKRVRFAENVKETKGNGEIYRKEKQKKLLIQRNCRVEMPANRVALYNGILRDRVHKVQCSY